MLIFASPSLLRQQTRLFHQQDFSIALVPTMGNLHDGHLKLVETAQKQADIVVVTLFVNPMPFDHPDHLAHYPHTLQQDYEKLSKLAVNVAFSPSVSVMYSQGQPKDPWQNTFVEVPQLSHWLEGASRPGHFRGVSTILCKLFNLVQPDTACFGEKDYQQLHIVRRMVADLNYDIDIIGVPTVRDQRGLALSSRNSLLTDQQQAIAPLLYQQLQQLAAQLTTDAINISYLTNSDGLAYLNQLLQQSCQHLTGQGFHGVELHIRDAHNLAPLSQHSKQAVLLIAAKLGDIRLIDNCVITINQP